MRISSPSRIPRPYPPAVPAVAESAGDACQVPTSTPKPDPRDSLLGHEMAAVSQRSSGIPQPVSKSRGPSRLMSMQAQFQQRAAADRQKKLDQLAPSQPAAPPRHAAANGRTTIEPGLRPAAPPISAPRSRPSAVSANSARSSASATTNGTGAAGLGGGKVRAMFNGRRTGHAAQTSPVGWDKSYPLDPIGRKSAATARPVTGSAPAVNHHSSSSGGGNTTARQPTPTSAARAAAPARVRRPEQAVGERRRPAPPRAAAPAPARAPPTPAPAAKENQPPTSRPPPLDPSLAQCPICTRAFAKDRLDKHQTICEKASKKKRKVFDPVKMRVQGTESETYLRKQKSKKAEPPAPAKKDWRKQHEEFIRNIRAAKKAQAILAAGGSLKDLPPPPPMDTSDYVQCPHCSRKFSEGAAERHIPKCATISCNKPAASRASKPAARGAGVGRTRR